MPKAVSATKIVTGSIVTSSVFVIRAPTIGHARRAHSPPGPSQGSIRVMRGEAGVSGPDANSLPRRLPGMPSPPVEEGGVRSQPALKTEAGSSMQTQVRGGDHIDGRSRVGAF